MIKYGSVEEIKYMRMSREITISGKTDVKFPCGANSKTCFLSFTRLLIPFVLKTAFTFA